MRALSAPEMLEVWERGLTQPQPQRLLTLLAAGAATTTEAAARTSVGQRDACLLTLRELAFGSQLCALATCRSCGERLELNFRTSDVRIETETETEGGWPINVAGYELRCHAPNSLDLIAIAAESDPAVARQQLLQLCLSDARHNGVSVAIGQLPAQVISEAVERMAAADPQADVQLALACPQCGHQWRAIFDIGTYFWSEIDAWAQRTLREVHTLAVAYGWRELDILMMSPWRRQFYLNCISG